MVKVPDCDRKLDLSISQISIQFQGGLVRSSVKSSPLPGDEARKDHSRRFGSRRGSVKGFSKKSRVRLLGKFAALDRKAVMAGKPVLMTLTYGQEWPDPETREKHRRAFLERFRRSCPKAWCIWRVEYQDRGAPHFHLVWVNLPYVPKAILAAIWLDVIGDEFGDWSSGVVEPPFTRIESIRSWRHLIGYVSKYVAKAANDGFAATISAANPSDEAASDSGLDYAPYLHAGRWWGVHNAAALPFAPAVIIEVFDAGKQFLDFRRAARRKSGRVAMLPVVDDYGKFRRWQAAGRVQGFTLFCDDASSWLRLWFYLGDLAP